MKNFFYLVLICFGLTSNSFSQITLNETNMPFGPQTYIAASASLTGFTLPSTGVNQTWDYSSLTLAGAVQWGNVLPPTASIPGATYVDTTVAVDFIASTIYLTDKYYTEDASAAKYLGTVTEAQAYNISSLTGGANDSCKFPSQYWVFNNPYNVIQYPATMSSKWTSSYTDKVNFILYIPAYFINNAPCYRVSHVNTVDTVVGWGTVTVPTLSGPSQPYDALMVKRNVVAADSFYINNAPASSLLLNAFGLSQGQQRITNRYIFWRENSSMPILQVNFGSDNFTTPTGVYYDATATVGITENSANNIVNIYPNPATDILNITGAQGSVTEIYDINGKLVYSHINDSPIQTISLTRFQKGMYIVKITGNNNVITKKINIVK